MSGIYSNDNDSMDGLNRVTVHAVCDDDSVIKGGGVNEREFKEAMKNRDYRRLAEGVLPSGYDKRNGMQLVKLIKMQNEIIKGLI